MFGIDHECSCVLKFLLNSMGNIKWKKYSVGNGKPETDMVIREWECHV